MKLKELLLTEKIVFFYVIVLTLAFGTIGEFYLGSNGLIGMVWGIFLYVIFSYIYEKHKEVKGK